MAGNCTGPYVGLVLTSLALLTSVSLNILLYWLRRRERQSRDVEEPLYPDSFPVDRFQDEEQLSQENPIYGNICTEVGGPMRTVDYGGYEPRTNQSARQDEQDVPADVSYASLDLSVAQKRKKKRKYQQKQAQTHQAQTHPPPMAQQNCLETGADSEVALPSRSSSLMMSRNSIYLNSHQVALETEERERERERERRSNREREMEIRNMHGDFEHSFGQSEPRHEQNN
ncbi:uncharacterized protein LOC108423816 [Pygocentrus nattereri]|uniref:uncharacterized protein LOC108423816 n=1 Tax=Pygocentrus nattereri TaxID=42514 RepID=UPI0008142D89|nr:uncharacterized protein LOC108423816 [Pygocentrus nattereri]